MDSEVLTSTEASSFRDPSGFVFVRDGQLYRQINQVYGAQYQQLMQSGLYQALVKAGLLIPHQEVGLASAASDDAFQVIQPDTVPFIQLSV